MRECGGQRPTPREAQPPARSRPALSSMQKGRAGEDGCGTETRQPEACGAGGGRREERAATRALGGSAELLSDVARDGDRTGNRPRGQSASPSVKMRLVPALEGPCRDGKTRRRVSTL